MDKDRPNGNDSRVVDVMQAALTDIMGDEPESSIFYEQNLTSPIDNDSARGSLELPRAVSPNSSTQQTKGSLKPSIASLGLVGEPRTRGVF